MGSLLSKSSKSGAGAVVRRYPSHPGGIRVPSLTARSPKDEVIIEDSLDPDMPKAYADRLQTMGIISNPSAVAPHVSRPALASKSATLSALRARHGLEQRADANKSDRMRDGSSGSSGSGGQSEEKLLDLRTIVKMLSLREHGATAQDIETKLNLPPGTSRRLGAPGVFALPPKPSVPLETSGRV